MSFLFEIQKRKTKEEEAGKRKRVMDVRVPVAATSRPTRFSSPALSRSTRAQYQQRAKALDGVKTTQSFRSQDQPQYIPRPLQVHQTLIRQKSLSSVSVWNRIQGLFAQLSFPRLAPNKLVYGSIMSGVAFGMVSLGLIEKTFESNANASEEKVQKVETVVMETENYKPEKDVFLQYFSDAADAEYQENVRELVKGYPIEEMLPYIFEKDRVTAAFLIGIAKKESNWGKRVPVLEGQDCFNYWGYRGQRRLMGSGGHTCFNSRKDAVDTVAKRLENLINSERLNTPAKLIVWKCGMSCEGHSRESVQKWIADVDAYYSEMMALESQNTELEEPSEGS